MLDKGELKMKKEYETPKIEIIVLEDEIKTESINSISDLVPCFSNH